MAAKRKEEEDFSFLNWPQRETPPALEPVPDAVAEDRSQQTLTRLDLAHAIYDARPGLSRREANRLVDEVLDEIVDALLAGEAVRLHEFGKFEVVEKRARPGRNPRTGEAMPIVARKVLRFSASPHMKEKVAGVTEAKRRA